MDINELFDGKARVVERFAEEFAEQKLAEKEQQTGRGPKVKGENSEKNPRGEAFFTPISPKPDDREGRHGRQETP